MPRLILDAGILGKIAAKRGGAVNLVRVLVSKKARKLSISPQAALVLLAADHNVPTTVYQRKLASEIKAEIRAGLHNVSGAASAGTSSARLGNKNRGTRSERSISDKQVVKRAIVLLIRDPQLRSRCSDILSSHPNS